MKYLLFMILFNTNISNNKEIKIKIIDSKTKEILVGVKDECSNEYSNLDGFLIKKKNDTIKLKYVSYENTTIYNIKNDTIIALNQLK